MPPRMKQPTIMAGTKKTLSDVLRSRYPAFDYYLSWFLNWSDEKSAFESEEKETLSARERTYSMIDKGITREPSPLPSWGPRRPSE